MNVTLPVAMPEAAEAPLLDRPRRCAAEPAHGPVQLG